ncbi:MAG TPA: phenylalanine--tRNA ligase subunit beta [Casimicrobiaceae bacterium]|jgi:phenylalanyl-tRNA synthetase beta chain|nr:phenylalanine--tRNA ligase subunit beta [Casimicrobiaceae bacterium]
MKFSEHWLRTLVDPPVDSKELGQRLTMAGLEVEDSRPVAPPFTGVVVGRVVSVSPHPNAERLTVCHVDVGADQPLAIVCGAPNAAPGVVAPCALIGAELPGGVVIKQAAVRGVDSQGMLCSAAELGLAEDGSGLLLLEATLEPGKDLRVALDLDDQLLTLKLTPNRADCLSLLGIAREVAAITSSRLTPPPLSPAPIGAKLRRSVRVEDALACPRFCARVIEGIDAQAPTPEWMRRRLERSGIRTISAVVDATNYVMLELGQPLHAYDDALLEGDIAVRFARRDEKLTLLNGQTLELEPDLLLVADEKKPLGLAGIMGGEHSGIASTTRNVFLEGAFWNPAVIQGKARRLAFATDASFRFERGVDFAIAPVAVERASRLVIELCGGAAGPLIDVRGEMPRRDPVRVRGARIARVLGVSVAPETVADIFGRLQLQPQRHGSDFVCTPPSFRFDLTLEEDFIEEVARLYGYDRIPSTPPVQPQTMLPEREDVRPAAAIRALLNARDYQEIITFSFVHSEWERALGMQESPIRVLNPIASNLDVMRSSLLGGLLDTLRTNVNRKQERVRIFEIGRCFLRGRDGYEQPLQVGGLAFGSALPEQWGETKRPVDFFDVKGDLEALGAPWAVRTEALPHAALHPGRSARVLVDGEVAGWLGELHPRLVRAFELPQAPVVFELAMAPLSRRPKPSAQTVSKLPVVRRDLAVVIDEAIPVQSVLDALVAAKPASVERLALFDVYRGPRIGVGKKSLAILVLMQDTARTLTDAEIDAAVLSLLRVIQDRFGGALRQ